MHPKLIALKNRYFPSDASYSTKEQLGYCSGIYGDCMGQDTVTEFSEMYARTYMGIGDKLMQLYGNIALAVGFLTSLLSGYILDKPVKPGKKSAEKIFIGTTPIPFAVTSMLLFIVPQVGNAGKNFVWMLINRLIFNISDTLYDASLNTLSLRITNDAQERKTFFTVGTFASALGSMLPAWIIPIVQRNLNNATSEKRCYFLVTAIFAVISVVMMYAPYFTTHDRGRIRQPIEIEKKETQEKLVWDKQTVLTMLHNRTFIVVEIATLFEQIRQVTFNLLLFLYRDVLNRYGLYAPMGTLSGTFSYIGLFSLPFLNKRFSSRILTSLGFAYTGVIYTIMALIGWKASPAQRHKKALLYGLLVAFAGMPNNIITASKKILVGDSIDYMEWYSEKQFGRSIHAEGFIVAMQSILGTVFNVIRTNLKFGFFSKANFREGTYIDAAGEEQRYPQSEFTQNYLFRMIVMFSIVGNFCAALTYLFDDYTGKKKERITAELAQMRERRAAVEAAAAYAAEGDTE